MPLRTPLLILLSAISLNAFAETPHRAQSQNSPVQNYNGPRLDSEQIHLALQNSRQMTQLLAKELKQGLQSSIAQGGLSAAVKSCRVLAPQVSQKLEQSEALKAGRTAIKIRNPNNKASNWELKQLQGFEQALQNPAKSADKLESYRLVEFQQQTALHYMKAIPTAAICLNCHGEKLHGDVAKTIKQVYPNDQAYGFKVGDLRGAFSIITPIR